jgi:peptidoglycan-associated lipoprotein
MRGRYIPRQAALTAFALLVLLGSSIRDNSLMMRDGAGGGQALGQRFASEVPTSITFDHDSARLSPEAMAALRRQAAWIRQYPELRFRVYGHTDLVGSNAYNQALGLRRAQAVVAYLADFLSRDPTSLDGEYATVLREQYLEGAVRGHPGNTAVTTQVRP